MTDWQTDLLTSIIVDYLPRPHVMPV